MRIDCWRLFSIWKDYTKWLLRDFVVCIWLFTTWVCCWTEHITSSVMKVKPCSSQAFPHLSHAMTYCFHLNSEKSLQLKIITQLSVMSSLLPVDPETPPRHPAKMSTHLWNASGGFKAPVFHTISNLCFSSQTWVEQPHTINYRNSQTQIPRKWRI